MAVASFFSRPLTLADSAVVYSLYALMKAQQPEMNQMASFLAIQESHLGTDGDVYIGDSSMTGASTGYTVRFNDAATATDNRFELTRGWASIDLTAIYLRPATNGVVVNVVAMAD